MLSLMTPPSKKIQTFPNPSKPNPLASCPDDRAQKTIPSSRTETSVRPRPTLFCSKVLSNFDPPVPPQNRHALGWSRSTSRKKGNFKLVLFVLDSFANRNHWNFPFLRQVPSHSRIQTKGQKAGPQMAPSRLSATPRKMTIPIRLYWDRRTGILDFAMKSSC